MVVLLVSRFRVRVQGHREGQLDLRRLVPGKVGKSVAQHARQVRDCARVLYLSSNNRSREPGVHFYPRKRELDRVAWDREEPMTSKTGQETQAAWGSASAWQPPTLKQRTSLHPPTLSVRSWEKKITVTTSFNMYVRASESCPIKHLELSSPINLSP